MEIICGSHHAHGLMWTFEEGCIACMIELLDDIEISKTRKKVIIMHFLRVIRSSCKEDIAVLLSNNDEVTPHILQLLVDMASMEGPEIVLYPLIEEALMESIFLLGDENVQKKAIMIIAKKLEDLGLKNKNFSTMANLLARLVQGCPETVDVFLNDHGEVADLLIQGLSYLDEEMQMSCSFAWFQILAQGFRSNPSVGDSDSAFHVLVGATRLQRIAFDLLCLLDACDHSEDLRLNMLGLLKVLIDSSHPVRDSLLKVAGHGEGLQVLLVFKKLIRCRKVKVQVATAQCLLVLLKGEFSLGYSELVFRADLTEYLFEALSTSSEALMSSLIRCLKLLSLQETFYLRHFDVYGVESLVRCMDSCCLRHLTSPLCHAYELLITILKRHEACGVKLFTDPGVYLHLLEVIGATVGVFQKFRGDPKPLDNVVEAFLQMTRLDHLVQAVPFKKLSEAASTLVECISTARKTPNSAAKHRHHHHRRPVAEDSPNSDGRFLCLLSELVAHQWKLLLLVLENDLLDEEVFQSNFQASKTIAEDKQTPDIFGCRRFFEHLFKSHFRQSITILMNMLDDTKEGVDFASTTTNFLCSVSTCYQSFRLLSSKRQGQADWGSFSASCSPLEFSRAAVEAAGGDIFTPLLKLKGRSSTSEETKSTIDRVLLEVLRPILMSSGPGKSNASSNGDDGSLKNSQASCDGLNVLFMGVADGLRSLEGSPKEMVCDFMALATSYPSAEDWTNHRDSQKLQHQHILNQGTALLALLYVNSLNKPKFPVPRRMELISSFVRVQSLLSTTSLMLADAEASGMILKFAIHLLTLSKQDEDDPETMDNPEPCVDEINQMDSSLTQLPEWMECRMHSMDLWCPELIKFLDWSYEHGLFQEFCEQFVLPRVMTTLQEKDSLIQLTARSEECLKSLMNIFTTSENDQILTNVLDVLRSSLMAKNGSLAGLPRYKRKELKSYIKARAISTVQKMFDRCNSDAPSKSHF